MALERGELIVREAGKGKSPRFQVRSGTTTYSPAEGEISQSVLERFRELAGKEVEFEKVAGQPKKIREVGGAFVQPRRDSSAGGGGRRDRDHERGGGGQSRRSESRPERSGTRPVRPSDFHNPYNFIPAPPRKISDPDLGDHPPVNHNAFVDGRYSGSIQVRMIAKTPLLVPDIEKVQDGPNGHRTFGLRVDGDGKPLIPASSVRGMLRTAYEAITNSRFGRFSRDQHDTRLTFRMEARDGLRLIPARVEGGQICLLTGTSGIDADGKPLGPMYAAWLPRYWDGRQAPGAVKYSDGSLPVHGDEVACWLELIQHHRRDKTENRQKEDFQYWRVRKVVRFGEPTGIAPEASSRPPARDRGSWHLPVGQPLRLARGWACVTNANINRKHDERVFFVGDARAMKRFNVTEAHRRMWRELVSNYQSIHQEDLHRRDRKQEAYDAYLGAEPGRTAWSRHIYTKVDQDLAEGTLCYVRLNADGTAVDGLFPVMISRELYATTAWALLHESVRPAASLDQLSPADRVFGWVNGDAGDDAGSGPARERVAARGLLRFGPVRCESRAADAVELFAMPGVPLAILAAPKPQQGRFYVARSPDGNGQQSGLSKQEAGYKPRKGLRGRKVYPHQRSLPDGHWRNPTEDRTQQARGTPAHFQEYRRPSKDGQEQRDDQNRSILGWVKPGAEFRFALHVQNLSAVELGALLWLLELPDDCFFRFGGGKPLGFGSVRLKMESCDVGTQDHLRARYSSWCSTTPKSDPRGASVKAFRDAVTRAYPPNAGGFDGVVFVRAFLAACRGHQDTLPIHYPRATASGQPGPPSPDGEFFKWFVSNEKDGSRYALRDLAGDEGLPTLNEPREHVRELREPHGRNRDRGGGGRG